VGLVNSNVPSRFRVIDHPGRMHYAVVSAAETGEVVQIGGSAVSPMLHMMQFGPIDWHVTSGENASVVADFGGPALGVGR
jgi:hypothetical protein